MSPFSKHGTNATTTKPQFEQRPFFTASQAAEQNETQRLGSTGGTISRVCPLSQRADERLSVCALAPHSAGRGQLFCLHSSFRWTPQCRCNGTESTENKEPLCPGRRWSWKDVANVSFSHRTLFPFSFFFLLGRRHNRKRGLGSK